MRPLITAATWGYFYIWCLHQPLGNSKNARAQASHYAGWCLDLEARMEVHEAGRGAKLTAAVIQRKISYTLFSWPAPLATEKLVKATKRTALYCPRCAELHGYRPRPIPTVIQLELDAWYGEWPDPVAGGMDYLQIKYLEGVRAARLPLRPSGYLDDDLL